MPRHHLIHICDSLEKRDGDNHFEYCECGAKFYINRKKQSASEDKEKKERHSNDNEYRNKEHGDRYSRKPIYR